MLRYILYLAYLCSCLGLGLFMSYLCDLFFIISLIFIIMNHITSLKQTHLIFFCKFLKTYPIIFGQWQGWRRRIIFKYPKFSLRVLLSFCLSFCQFQFGVAYKSVAYIKKVCMSLLPSLQYCSQIIRWFIKLDRVFSSTLYVWILKIFGKVPFSFI